MSLFQDELDRSGCRIDESEVRDFLTATLTSLFPERSADDVLDHPADAIAFCESIRENDQIGYADDFLILSMLIDTRKKGLLPSVPKGHRHPLAKQLMNCGCGVQVEEFIDFLSMVLEDEYSPPFNDESIRFRPLVAKAYCRKVRDLIGCSKLTDDLILRSLNNARKHSQRKASCLPVADSVPQVAPIRPVKTGPRKPRDLQRVASLCDQASNAVRLEILLILKESELNVGQLFDVLGVHTQPAISHHLQLMKLAGLVEPRRNGRNNIYYLTTDGFAVVDAISSVIPSIDA